ncbi:hypothetical protein [Luteimonas sp. MHLX1A]|uniref:hypothetical protein n=1 Tax=Alterluteimonas muca TaxID=2878684 RepID=UPI001E2F3C7A|nr:hypothetical protein [Luteimonas sp. MHLX1A]MCD9046767.1 hypothetical protein [Luteimonas sp. MHLX1A]
MVKTHLALACAAALGATSAMAADPTWRQLEVREQRIALLNSEMEELSLERQLQELRQQVVQGEVGQAPVLIGIATGRAGLSAEFMSQQGIQKAAVGDMVGNGWFVRGIDKNRVELALRTGNRVRMYHAVVGSTPTPVGAP